MVRAAAFVIAVACDPTAGAQLLPREAVETTVDVYKLNRPDYTPPGFYLGDFHISSSLPPDLPGNGVNPLQPATWLPLYDPMISQTVAYDDNIYARNNHRSEDMINTTTESVNFETDYAPNLLTGRIYAAQQNFYVHPSENAEAYEADLAGRVEVTDKGFFGANVGFTRQPQLRASLEADTSLGFRPIFNQPNAMASFTQEFGKATAEIQYSFNKIAYNNGFEAGRNLVQQSVSSYFAYHISDAATIFIRPSFQSIRYRLNPDLTDSTSLGITGGLRYNLPGVFKLDILAGIQEQDFRNPAFSSVYQPQIDGNLLYNFSPITSVEITAANVINPLVRYCGTVGGVCTIAPSQEIGVGPLTVSGGPNIYVATTAGFTVQHEFWHDLLGELKFNFERDEFRGIRPRLVQETYQLVVNARYLVNRNAEIDLAYNYFSRTANFPNVNFYNSGAFDESVLSLTFKAGF